MVAQSQIIWTAMENVSLGRPAAEALAAEVDRLDARRVFLHVSTNLNTKTDEISRIEKALGKRHAATHDGMPPHAPRSAVIRAAEHAREVNADLIVSVGGGSVNDASAVMLLCLKHNLRKPEDLEPYHIYVDDHGVLQRPQYEGPDIRMIAIPTTLSGGEFNTLSGATDERIQLKQGYDHRLMAPISVILDPAITVHTPEWLWMSTGVRSLDHAMETLGSFQSNDFADGMADSALRLLSEGLARVKADPRDLEGRLKCQIGAWQSMIPVIGGIPMGASHAIGHVLGGTCGVPHGYTSCVMAPYVLAWNASVNGERQKRIAAGLGKPGGSASEAADRFIRSLGMPRTLKEVNVDESQFDKVARYTMEDLWARTNPRPVNGPQEVMEILRMAAG
ncbi:MAG: iron-containing alcohol dehydrogenase [Alphaproteobacteria bacterium]|nr:iron-containing alcohol dehydrogenase [Alphaproteobacteria bacterium]